MPQKVNDLWFRFAENNACTEKITSFPVKTILSVVVPQNLIVQIKPISKMISEIL